MRIVIGLLAGYLAGSVSFAYLFSLFLTGKDIRDIGTRNPGAANVARNIGKIWGLFAWLGDTVKGIVPMLLTRGLGVENIIILAFVGLAAVMGHCYSLFLHFKGGRGAATAGSVVLFLMPLVFPIVIVLWFIAQKINPRSPKVLISCTFFYFFALFLLYGIRVGALLFFQTAIVSFILITASFFMNPELLQEIRFGSGKE